MFAFLRYDFKFAFPILNAVRSELSWTRGCFYRLYSKLLIGQQVADLHIESSQQPADPDKLPKSVKPSVSISQTLALPIVDLLVRVPCGLPQPF